MFVIVLFASPSAARQLLPRRVEARFLRCRNTSAASDLVVGQVRVVTKHDDFRYSVESDISAS